MASERLQYERLHPAEFDSLELYKHASTDAPAIGEITRHVTWEPYGTPKEAFDWVKRCGNASDSGEDATYVIRPKSGDRAGEFAGLAGIHPNWKRRQATLGTWLRKSFWGNGYSGERAARMLKLAFEQLDVEVVTVSHDPENQKSQRAIEKYVERFGGRREGLIRNDIVMDGHPRDSVYYSISREEYAAAVEDQE